MIAARPGQTVQQLLFKLLERRGLRFNAFELLETQASTLIDLESDASSLAGLEVRFEPRVVFHLMLVCGKSLLIRGQPRRQLGEVVKPILMKYGLKMEQSVIVKSATGDVIQPRTLLASLDGLHLKVSSHSFHFILIVIAIINSKCYGMMEELNQLTGSLFDARRYSAGTLNWTETWKVFRWGRSSRKKRKPRAVYWDGGASCGATLCWPSAAGQSRLKNPAASARRNRHPISARRTCRHPISISHCTIFPNHPVWCLLRVLHWVLFIISSLNRYHYKKKLWFIHLILPFIPLAWFRLLIESLYHDCRLSKDAVVQLAAKSPVTLGKRSALRETETSAAGPTRRPEGNRNQLRTARFPQSTSPWWILRRLYQLEWNPHRRKSLRAHSRMQTQTLHYLAPH